ncbi:MAG: winged helix-turn-helix transcriptional regulator, partial [Treponema sp.]|nr:winged helix-turn-helix transcriptional regulator [Treponema sp.]
GDVLNIIQSDESNRIVERKEVSLFENDAFREAIVNAFVHNKWASGNEPMISVFSDRIEILSRGELASEQTIAGFFAGISVPVNRKLSEIFLQLHISEKTGRGVPKITGRYGKKAFTFNENSIVVKIPFNWINVMADKNKKMPIEDKKKYNKISTTMNQTQQKVLNEIQKNPRITKPELCKKLNFGKTTIDKAISFLRENGLIIREGSNKSGWWKV